MKLSILFNVCCMGRLTGVGMFRTSFFMALTGALEEGILYVPACIRDIMLRKALKEFLKHSKESRGVPGQEKA